MNTGFLSRWRLRPGERILWEGQPDVRAYTFAGSILLIPFSIVWAGFAFFWEGSVIAMGAPLLFWLWGIPFVLIGLYIVGGRFVVARREAQRTWYAITTERVLIQSGAFRRRLSELDLTNLPPTELTAGRNATGTITFGTVHPYARFFGPSWMGMKMGQAIVAVRDPERVFEILSEARRDAMREAFGSGPPTR
ncbi:MAG: hypothetical protein HY263_05795 [Chloroflexi bacterium]|nr:hypothetical protein [Chloroflexota bacterium]